MNPEILTMNPTYTITSSTIPLSQEQLDALAQMYNWSESQGDKFEYVQKMVNDEIAIKVIAPKVRQMTPPPVDQSIEIAKSMINTIGIIK